MARLFAPTALVLAALLLAGANAIIVGRVYRPIVATPFGASPSRAVYALHVGFFLLQLRYPSLSCAADASDSPQSAG